MNNMTPKEKAIELFGKYAMYLRANLRYDEEANEDAKVCALIAVNEILDNMMLYQENFDADKPVHHKSYWESVKKEIEKL